MGKKGRRCKTRWRRLPIGGEEGEEEECCEEGDCPPSTALGGRERAKGGGSDGAASPQLQQQNGGPRQATAAPASSSTAQHHAPYRGGARAGRGPFGGGRRGGAAVTDGIRKGAAVGGASGVYTFNEEEYTKITTPRQDVLFKKGYLMARKKDVPAATTNGATPSSAEATNGDATPNGTSGTHSGDASSSSEQPYTSAPVNGSGGDEDGGGCNGYTYVNGYTNGGYSYGGAYHVDQGGAAIPNGGAYYVNGGSYELYDPYAAMAAAAAGYSFPYVGAPPPHQPPPHTLPPLQTIDWYASRPPGATGDVQWCQLVASPGYSETRRKRYSTDSQNCSPPSSESTGPPGSPQEEAISSPGGGDACHAHQTIPQYHHAHVFQGPHPHAATYVYPGYLFGPAVYSVNGVPLAAATPLHPLHGLSQSIHVHPSAAVAAPGPVPGAQGGVSGAGAPGSDGGSQRRRKKKRRRKRKRGLTDDASEETSSEVGEEEAGAGGSGGAVSVTCGACSAVGDEEFEEEDDEEEEQVGPVVVVRLGSVLPLVMSQQPGPPGPPPAMAAAPPTQPYGSQADGPAAAQASAGREAEASSTDCSELSGQLESSSTSGGEETMVPAEGSAAGGRGDDQPPEDEATTETREVWTQSPPEAAVQVDEPPTPPPSPQPPEVEVSVEETAALEYESKEPQGDDTTLTPAAEKLAAEDKPQGAQKPSRRRNGRGRNNKPSVQVIHSEESPPDVPPPPAVAPPPAEVEVLETEGPELIQLVEDTPKEVMGPSLEPIEGPKDEPPTAKTESAPVLEESVISKAAPAPVQQMAPVPVKTAPEPSKTGVEPPEKERTEEKAEEKKEELLPLVEDSSTHAEVESTIERLSPPEPPRPFAAEPEASPPSSLPLDTFTFKPEPYKHPMLKSPRKELKEESPLIAEVLSRERNGDANLDHEEEGKIREHSPTSRHLQDMPRRKARLKKPPEREQTPEIEDAEVTGEPELAGVTVALEETVLSAAPAVARVEDNNGEGEHGPIGSGSEVNEDASPSKEETLTEVVSKWLEENSDALPESLEEMKEGGEKTEAVSAVEAEAEGGMSTGSKNGVRNPFPAPSSRLPERSECVRVCESSVSACAFSRDGPAKRVANRIFGAGDDGAKSERGEEEGADADDEDRGSCEWEPMTVEAPKRNFSDLEAWKRLRGGLGGSVEALRSLGSYEEEEEESRKARLNMCDPTASVAKYYCLGAAREPKSPSPGEGPPLKAREDTAPTDSGVQTDEEEEVIGRPIAAAEEAREEEEAPQARRAHHKPVGLGKTAAFVARQIGATESAKGPFPCGICCIIQ
ncbi:uncharacterized protein [Hetaerina americana]|uniref:uncharacterized protein n=1 Tax=Hetaerina americana TaxID=62018 RepID=UPI003A7F4396